MIIDYPTALYQSVLPQDYTQVGNITFTISSTDPPRPKIAPVQLQPGEVMKPLPPKIYDPTLRRTTFGEFVFSISSGNKSEVSIGNKAYEVGQTIEFAPEETTSPLNTPQVPDDVDLQQNTNVLDLKGAGLTDAEIAQFTVTAANQMDVTVQQLNDLKSQIASLYTQIQNNQRLINETRKIRDAAAVVFATDTTILDKMIAREKELLLQRESLILQSNAVTALANQKYNELLGMREVVR